MENIKFIKEIMAHSSNRKGKVFGNYMYYKLNNETTAKVWCQSDGVVARIINDKVGEVKGHIRVLVPGTVSRPGCLEGVCPRRGIEALERTLVKLCQGIRSRNDGRIGMSQQPVFAVGKAVGDVAGSIHN